MGESWKLSATERARKRAKHEELQEDGVCIVAKQQIPVVCYIQVDMFVQH